MPEYSSEELKRLADSLDRLTPALPMGGVASDRYLEAQESIVSARGNGSAHGPGSREKPA